jgi:gamma-glutamylcyclotransferase (GGCT)/AIG2-like uncharacterized protein YtfP
MTSLRRIFVYGTLTSGGPGHHRLTTAPCGIHEARTRGLLYALPEGYPALVDGEGDVWGELVEFEDTLSEGAWSRTLARLDDYEGYAGPGHPANLYERRVVRAVSTAGAAVSAWAYVYAIPERARLLGTPIPHGDWRRYLSECHRRSRTTRKGPPR